MENDVIKSNLAHLANNRVRQFTNLGLGDEWYALHLEQPKVKTQRQSPFAKRHIGFVFFDRINRIDRIALEMSHTKTPRSQRFFENDFSNNPVNPVNPVKKTCHCLRDLCVFV
jgi:hypothetical protein